MFLVASGAACSNPGYRTEVYPGQEGQYTLKHVPETPPAPVQNETVQSSPAAAPAPSGVQGSAAAPAPVATEPMAAAPTTGPVDDNLNQVETNWSKLSDSDKALLAATAKRLAGGR
jgi:hypothetical protein